MPLTKFLVKTSGNKRGRSCLINVDRALMDALDWEHDKQIHIAINRHRQLVVWQETEASYGDKSSKRVQGALRDIHRATDDTSG